MKVSPNLRIRTPVRDNVQNSAQLSFHGADQEPAEGKFAHWCNLKTDILEVDCPDAQTFEQVQRDLAPQCKSQNTKLITKTAVEGRVQFVAKTCACLRISPSISEIIEENKC